MWMLVQLLLMQQLYPMLHFEVKKFILQRMDWEMQKFIQTALKLPLIWSLGIFMWELKMMVWV